MKFKNTFITMFTLLALTVFTTSAFALPPGDKIYAPGFGEAKSLEERPSIVKWVGVVRGVSGAHTTEHMHELEFVRNSDQKVFNIEDSPALLRKHHNLNRNMLVEIEAELTPKFLFWGGNLIVKKLAVVNLLDETPHETAAIEKPVRHLGDKR